MGLSKDLIILLLLSLLILARRLPSVTIIGCALTTISVVFGIQTLILWLAGNALQGFTTVILLILLIGGGIMISLGVIGLYIAKIYEEVKKRPRFIISETTE